MAAAFGISGLCQAQFSKFTEAIERTEEDCYLNFSVLYSL